MTYETKHSLGDRVYTIQNNEIREVEVIKVVVEQSRYESYPRISYGVIYLNVFDSIKQANLVFATKAELIATL